MYTINNSLTPLFRWQKEFLINFLTKELIEKIKSGQKIYLKDIYGLKNQVLIASRRMRKTSTLLMICKTLCTLIDGFSVYYFVHKNTDINTIIIDNTLPNGERVYKLAGDQCRLNKSTKTLFYENGSTVKFFGADRGLTAGGSSKVGGNCHLVIFDEFSLYQYPEQTYNYILPIIVHSRGSLIISGTPRGMANSLYQKYVEAATKPDWNIFHKNIYDYPDEFKHVIETCEFECRSRTILLQEYKAVFVSDDASGHIYSEFVYNASKEGRVIPIKVQKETKTYIGADIAVKDQTVLIFAQINENKDIVIVDVYANSAKNAPFYMDIILDKGYNYEKVFMPFDANNREKSSAKTYIQHCRDYLSSIDESEIGDTLQFLPRTSDIMADINTIVKGRFHRIIFNSTNCEELIKALHQYHRKWIEGAETYQKKPYHDWSSDYADALRYLMVGLYREFNQPETWCI